MALFIYLLFFSLMVSVSAEEKKDIAFFVKPGAGTLSSQIKLNKYQCKFIYAAQGGTQEEWTIQLEAFTGGSGVICTVERAMSYLYFQEFRLELTGPMVSIAGADIKKSQRDEIPLEQEEYTLESNSVSSVAGKFKNRLEKISVFSPIPHDDL